MELTAAHLCEAAAFARSKCPKKNDEERKSPLGCAALPYLA